MFQWDRMMFQHKIHLFCLGTVLAGSFAILPVMADGMPENQEKTPVVQSDSAQKTPETAEEILKVDEKTENTLNQQAKTNKSDSSDEAVATITAEGDFMVPTFLLPTPDTEKNQNPNTVNRVEATETHTKTVRELPVVKITQTELIPVREQMAVERRLTGKTTKTTQMYKEALARSQGISTPGVQKNTTVQESDSKTADNKRAVDSQDGVLNNILSGDDGAKETSKVKKKKLLLPLKPLPAEAQPQEDLSGTEPLYTTYTSEMADKALSDAQNENSEPLIMPQDIKVTFYPNSAEFSGQTVKWIKVFSLQARRDPRYTIEIRLSRDNPLIQQKRLFVIQRILMNNGLSLHQIAIDYVNRPENSLILRMVRKEEDIQTRKVQLKNGQVKENKTINW